MPVVTYTHWVRFPKSSISPWGWVPHKSFDAIKHPKELRVMVDDKYVASFATYKEMKARYPTAQLVQEEKTRERGSSRRTGSKISKHRVGMEQQ